MKAPEELDMQTIDNQRWQPFQFLTSLRRFVAVRSTHHGIKPGGGVAVAIVAARAPGR